MGRRFIDCREYPSDAHCSVAIAADNDDELLEAAVEHAVKTHHHEDNAELRAQLRSMFKDAPAEAGMPR